MSKMVRGAEPPKIIFLVKILFLQSVKKNFFLVIKRQNVVMPIKYNLNIKILNLITVII